MDKDSIEEAMGYALAENEEAIIEAMQEYNNELSYEDCKWYFDWMLYESEWLDPHFKEEV